MGYLSCRDLCSKQTGGLRALYLLPVSHFAALEYSRRTNCYYGLKCFPSSLIRCFLREGEALFEEQVGRKQGIYGTTQRLTVGVAALNNQPDLLSRLIGGEGFIAFVEDMHQRVKVVGYNHIFGCGQPLRLESLDATTNSRPDESCCEVLTLQTHSVCRAGVLMDDIENLVIR